MNQSLEQEAMRQRDAISRIPFTGMQGLGETVNDYLRSKRPEPELNLTVNEYLDAKMMQKR